jgi:aspartate/tyrosine/aromatic aminotransferase
MAKNFGLYGERIGAVHLVCPCPDTAAKVMSQVKLFVRPMYSNPPIHGAAIVAKILTTPELNNMWREELAVISGRIQEMRALLRRYLEQH